MKTIDNKHLLHNEAGMLALKYTGTAGFMLAIGFIVSMITIPIRETLWLPLTAVCLSVILVIVLIAYLVGKHLRYLQISSLSSSLRNKQHRIKKLKHSIKVMNLCLEASMNELINLESEIVTLAQMVTAESLKGFTANTLAKAEKQSTELLGAFTETDPSFNHDLFDEPVASVLREFHGTMRHPSTDMPIPDFAEAHCRKLIADLRMMHRSAHGMWKLQTEREIEKWSNSATKEHAFLQKEYPEAA